jgi:prevent-host-death family protein
VKLLGSAGHLNDLLSLDRGILELDFLHRLTRFGGMDGNRYSASQARARFSELIEKVRGGRAITVTYRGEPIAEIRPIGRNNGTLARIAWLRSRGVIGPPGSRSGELPVGPPKPGALKRFLDERG